MRPLVILSPCTGNKDNALAMHHMRQSLDEQNYAYTVALGCYQGVEEPAYIVNAPTPDSVVELLHLAKFYDQEYILYADQHNDTVLMYTDDRPPLSIGKFTQLPEHVAKEKGNWTYTADNTTYWGTV